MGRQMFFIKSYPTRELRRLRLKFKVYDDIYIVNLFFDGNMFLAIIDCQRRDADGSPVSLKKRENGQ